MGVSHHCLPPEVSHGHDDPDTFGAHRVDPGNGQWSKSILHVELASMWVQVRTSIARMLIHGSKCVDRATLWPPVCAGRPEPSEFQAQATFCTVSLQLGGESEVV